MVQKRHKKWSRTFWDTLYLVPSFFKAVATAAAAFCCNLGIRCPNKDSLQRLFKGQLMAIGLTLEHDKWSIGSASDGWFWTSPPFCYVKNMRRVLHRQYTEKGQKRPEKKKDHFSILLIRIISWRHCVRQTKKKVSFLENTYYTNDTLDQNSWFFFFQIFFSDFPCGHPDRLRIRISYIDETFLVVFQTTVCHESLFSKKVVKSDKKGSFPLAQVQRGTKKSHFFPFTLHRKRNWLLQYSWKRSWKSR